MKFSIKVGVEAKERILTLLDIQPVVGTYTSCRSIVYVQ